VRRGRALLAFAAVALFALALRAPVADIPFERDEGEYAYLAWRWLEGDVPYRDGFDQKPPAVLAGVRRAAPDDGRRPAADPLRRRALHARQPGAAARLRRAHRLAARGSRGGGAVRARTTVPGTLGNAANVELFALLPIVGAALAAQRGSQRAASGAAALSGAAAGPRSPSSR